MRLLSLATLIAAILAGLGLLTSRAFELPSYPSASAPAPPRSAVPFAVDVASYVISATLSADGKTIAGEEDIIYRNPGPDSLSELYIHLYLNAFRSSDSLWMQEAGRQHRGFGFDPQQAGSIDVHSISMDGVALALTTGGDDTVARVDLPQPLLPDREVRLNVSWTSYLPRVFARTGWAPGNFTLAGQWYPKLAVYDPRRGGWDKEPWHANAEFFHDFGSYELAVTAPSPRTVVGSGEPAGTNDNGDGTSTWRFRSRSVTDVVWMAAEHFTVRTLAAGDVVVAVALPDDRVADADHHLAVAASAIERYGDWLGGYPWPRITVVFPPPQADGAGGMEYPGLVTSMLESSWLPGVHLVDVTTVHELAHQWFPMQVATNEGRDPWMDEGFADYLTQRLMAELYGADRSLLDLPFAHASYLDSMRTQLSVAARLPITKPAWNYSPQEYGAAVYAKAALFLTTLERVVGRDRFTASLRDYVSAWRWRHPLPEDLRKMLDEGPRAGDAATPETSPGNVSAWLDQIAFGQRVLDVSVTADASRTIVTREGDATLPVQGVLTTRSGRQLPWTLAPNETSLEVPAPDGDEVLAVDADPQSKLLVETNRLDDAYSVSADAGSLIGLWAKLAQLFAVALQLLGQMG